MNCPNCGRLKQRRTNHLCNPCYAKYHKEWRLKNRDHWLKTLQEYQKKRSPFCSRCGKVKELRRGSYCRKCGCEKVKQWSIINKERYLVRTRKWVLANKEKIRLNTLRSELKNFGLSIEQYDSMVRDQNGACKICNRINVDGQRLAVDHDHKTGRVRGLLCRYCNIGLGNLQDSIDILSSAIKYLKNQEILIDAGVL